jgi:hypothetical protein|tara:strand:+ start:257 stop:469 length:213 start_codon:yes stop_codon:yes gene_type:complete
VKSANGELGHLPGKRSDEGYQRESNGPGDQESRLLSVVELTVDARIDESDHSGHQQGHDSGHVKAEDQLV